MILLSLVIECTQIPTASVVEVGTLPSIDRETLAPKLRSLEIILDPRHEKLALENLAELLPAAPSDRDPEFLVYAPVSDRDRAVERRWKERIQRAFTQANPYGDLARIEEWRLAIDSVPEDDEYAAIEVLGRLFTWKHLEAVIDDADLRPGKRTWTASYAALPGDVDLTISDETRALWRESSQYARSRLGETAPVSAIDGASIRVHIGNTAMVVDTRVWSADNRLIGTAQFSVPFAATSEAEEPFDLDLGEVPETFDPHVAPFHYTAALVTVLEAQKGKPVIALAQTALEAALREAGGNARRVQRTCEALGQPIRVIEKDDVILIACESPRSFDESYIEPREIAKFGRQLLVEQDVTDRPSLDLARTAGNRYITNRLVRGYHAEARTRGTRTVLHDAAVARAAANQSETGDQAYWLDLASVDPGRSPVTRSWARYGVRSPYAHLLRVWTEADQQRLVRLTFATMVGQWDDVEAYRRGMSEENFERAPKEYATAELVLVHCGVAGESYYQWPLVMAVRPE